MKERLSRFFAHYLIPVAASVLLRLLFASLRCRTLCAQTPRRYWSKREPILLACWHDQLLLTVCHYSGPGARMLISASKDGEMLARTFALLGQGAVRGSSGSKGRAALKALVKLTRSDYDLAITPDGPRGPRHEVKDGILMLAKVSGRPIIPLAFACSRGHRFGSWDRFMVPFPFSQAVFRYGEPVLYDSEEPLEAFRKRVKLALDDNTHEAQHYLRSHGLPVL